MEEHIRDGILLAALEDRLHAVALVKHLVFRTDAARGGVQHDIDRLNQLLEAAGNRNALGIKRRLVRAVDQIEIVFDVVRADHIVFGKRTDGQRRREIRDTDQLHIALHGYAVRQTLTNRAVTGNADSDFLAHENILLIQ